MTLSARLLASNMRGVTLCLVFGSALFVWPASADWSAKQKSDFMADCIGSCEKNEKVQASQKQYCLPYCTCAATEGQKAFNESDYDEMNRDAIAGKTSEKLTKFQTLYRACNAKAFK